MGISSTVVAGGVGARKRVLIVDDQRTFADLLELALAASADLDCDGVASGPEEAIALVHRRPPDLVIMDLHFATSTLDGVDATAEIKRVSPSTQVVVLTGHADRTVLRRAAEAGACSLIPKDGSAPVSQGLMDEEALSKPAVVKGVSTASALGITVEPAGGSTSPTTPPVAEAPLGA